MCLCRLTKLLFNLAFWRSDESEYQNEVVNQLWNSPCAQNPSEAAEPQAPGFVPLPQHSACIIGAKEGIVISLYQKRCSYLCRILKEENSNTWALFSFTSWIETLPSENGFVFFSSMIFCCFCCCYQHALLETCCSNVFYICRHMYLQAVGLRTLEVQLGAISWSAMYAVTHWRRGNLSWCKQFNAGVNCLGKLWESGAWLGF